MDGLTPLPVLERDVPPPTCRCRRCGRSTDIPTSPRSPETATAACTSYREAASLLSPRHGNDGRAGCWTGPLCSNASPSTSTKCPWPWPSPPRDSIPTDWRFDGTSPPISAKGLPHIDHTGRAPLSRGHRQQGADHPYRGRRRGPSGRDGQRSHQRDLAHGISQGNLFGPAPRHQGRGSDRAGKPGESACWTSARRSRPSSESSSLDPSWRSGAETAR